MDKIVREGRPNSAILQQVCFSMPEHVKLVQLDGEIFFPLRNYNFFELIVLPKNNLAVYQTHRQSKMVLTAAQTTSFFENADQMGVQHATVVQLALEGIQTVDDLADFDKQALQQLADNLRRPGGRVPNPDQEQLLDQLFQHQPLFLEQNPRND